MGTQCQECQAGPSGQFGHDNLFTHAFFGAEIVMRCRTCGTCWSRRTKGEPFVWQEASALSGSLLPMQNA